MTYMIINATMDGYILSNSHALNTRGESYQNNNIRTLICLCMTFIFGARLGCTVRYGNNP